MAVTTTDQWWGEKLKIAQQETEQAEAEKAQLQLMISGGGGNRPGEDGPYRPPDPKEVPGVPPGYPHIPKMLAHGEYFNEYGVPIQDPTRGMDPSGNPITIPHLQQTPEEAEQNRQLHMDKYHPKNDLQISGLNLGGGRYLHNYEIKMLRDAFTGASEKERNRLLEMYSDKPFKGLV